MTSYTQAYTLYVNSKGLLKKNETKKALDTIIESCIMYVDLLKNEKNIELKNKMSKQANHVLSEAEIIKKKYNENTKVAALIEKMPSVEEV